MFKLLSGIVAKLNPLKLPQRNAGDIPAEGGLHSCEECDTNSLAVVYAIWIKGDRRYDDVFAEKHPDDIIDNLQQRNDTLAAEVADMLKLNHALRTELQKARPLQQFCRTPRQSDFLPQQQPCPPGPLASAIANVRQIQITSNFPIVGNATDPITGGSHGQLAT